MHGPGVEGAERATNTLRHTRWDYFAEPRVLAELWKTAMIWSRSAVTAAIVATAISASSIAYSAIDAPLSSFTNVRIIIRILPMQALSAACVCVRVRTSKRLANGEHRETRAIRRLW